METKTVLSVAFVAVIILGFFWKNVLNFFLLFVPEKKEIKGIVFELKKEKYKILEDDSSSKVIKLKKYFITIETKNEFVEIQTDKNHFLNFKKGEKFDFMVIKEPFSKKLVLK